jgi:hypothetical protein
MKKNLPLFQNLLIASFLFLISFGFAVETREIDNIRAKSVLNNDDLAVIDKFVSDAVNEIVTAKDLTALARLRSVIVTRKGDQAQYAEQYSKSCKEHIGRALERTARIESEAERNTIRMNLFILIDNLEDPRLANLSIQAIDDKSAIVRYWALRFLTRPELFLKISAAGADEALKQEILSVLEKRITIVNSQELRLLIDFAGLTDIPETEQFLLKIADWRIKQYADWSIEGYLSDIGILKNLYSRLTKAAKQQDKEEFGSRFGQLYSYAMQKYIKDIKGGNFLNPNDTQHLISVLVEIEDKCIGQITGLQQTVIKTAIEKDDYNSLLMEHGRLFGDDIQSGVIPSKYGFSYGTTAAGAKMTSPKILPDAPNNLSVND